MKSPSWFNDQGLAAGSTLKLEYIISFEGQEPNAISVNFNGEELCIGDSSTSSSTAAPTKRFLQQLQQQPLLQQLQQQRLQQQLQQQHLLQQLQQQRLLQQLQQQHQLQKQRLQQQLQQQHP